MRPFYLVFLLMFLFPSCKDALETPGELMAKKLETDIKSSGENIQYISVYSIYNNSIIFSGTSSSITSDGFIIITNANESATFNLGELKSYKITSNGLALFY